MAEVVITGANRGIGLELARRFMARGDRVTAVCRRGSSELKALDLQSVPDVDVTRPADLEKLAAALSGRSVDVLINNAGILVRDDLDTVTAEGMRAQFEVNTVAPLSVVRTLLPCLRSGSKIIMITSRMGSVADNTSGGYYGYRASKAALNMVAASLAMDLRERGIAVAALHPGMVATEMTGHSGVPVGHAADGLVARIDALTLADSGGFWHAEGQRLPW